MVKVQALILGAFLFTSMNAEVLSCPPPVGPNNAIYGNPSPRDIEPANVAAIELIVILSTPLVVSAILPEDIHLNPVLVSEAKAIPGEPAVPLADKI